MKNQVVVKKWIDGQFHEVRRYNENEVKQIRYHSDGLELVLNGNIMLFDSQCVVEFEQYEQSSSFDWKSFRNQAAKDFVAALIPVIDYEHTTDKIIVDNAISLSEELIKQLKERG